MNKKTLLIIMLLALGAPWAAWGQKTLPYEYGFENNDLTGEGWTRNSLSSNTNIYSIAKRTGNYGFLFYYYADPQYLISPELTGTSSGVTVEFYYKTSSTFFPRTFQVGYSTTTTDVSAFTFGDEITASDAEWTLLSLDCPAGTKYVAIKHENTSYGNLYLDDFIFEEYTEYPTPKSLTLTNYTSSTATLDWTARTGQDHWDVYYSTNQAAPDANTVPQISNTEAKPCTITGLEAGTPYYAYVRGNYNNGEHYSDWSAACTFEVGCYTPNISQQVYATSNQVGFMWTPVGTETSWQVAFSDQQGFDPDEVESETVTTQYYGKEGLATGVTYYARVRAVCGEGDYSDWSEEVSMTTECFAPSNLQESSVTPTTATLAWTQGSNETQWQVSYSTTENFTPESGTIVTVDTRPYTLTGLTLNTQYYAYVRAVCGENIYSDWSNICAFMPKYVLTVGEGTNTNSYIPFYSLYVDAITKSQFIVPATDLEDLLYANINKLTFYANMESANFGNATFDVLISELDGVTSFETAAFFDWSSMSTAYSGSVSISGGKMEINLNAPYQYMGGNLLIGFNQTASGTWSSLKWYGTSTTAYSSYGGRESSYSSDYSRQQFIPKVSFSYTPGTAPTCLKPSSLIISQTPGSATLTWTAGADETHWNVQYKEASASEWSAAIAVEDTPTCTLNNLSPATSYQVRVQADCGGGDTSSWIAGSFTTSCGPTNVPYSHDFDSDATGSSATFPQCWTKINDSDDPDYNSYPYVMGSNAYSNSNCLFFMRLYDYTALNQIAVLPEMSADVRTLQLSFYAKLGSGTNQPLSVGVMTNPDDASTFVKIEDVTVASDEYAQYFVAFDEYDGAGRYIALKCERGSAYNQIYVDDVEVTENSVCFAPENPQISNIAAHSSVFSWTAGSDVANWQVQYKRTADAEWSEAIAVSGTASHTLSNLLPATEYHARVRTDCGDDNYSDWVASKTFTTDCGYMPIPFSHYFDSDATGTVAPTCWYFSSGGYRRIYESASMAHSGSNLLLMQKPSTETACYVALPAVNTTEHPINTLKLTFYARMWNSSIYSNYLSIGVMTDPNDIDTYQFVTSVDVRDAYSLHEIYFDDYAGEGQYIVLRCYNTSNYFCIDDIEISVAPTCRQPLELSGNYSSAHEANIRWKTRDLHQCNYQVSYSTSEGFNPEDGTIVDVEFESDLVNAGTPYRYYDLTGLEANTTYYFYVRANCGEGDFSAWSEDYANFTTGEACPGPDYVSTDVKKTYVKFEWYGDVDTEWEFQYKESSSEDWLTPSDFVVSPGSELNLTYTLHGLTPGTDYNARLRKHCGMYSCPEVDDGYSEWYEMSFTTYDGCYDGDPWMCTSHLGTQATLRWLNNAQDMRWQIRYRLSSEYDYPEENIVTTDVLPEASLQQYTLTGLQTNSTYYWQVRGYCDENDQSDWSDEDYFFTRSSDGYITVDKAHPYYEDFENGMPDDWSRMNLYNYDMNHYDAWECIDANALAGVSFPASRCISSCRECMSWASTGSMMLMPAIHIDENATSAVLSFWSKDAYNDSDARGTKMIWVNGNYLSTEYTAFDLGCVYQKSSKANYWRKCFVNLDDYIGQTVIIAFDYVVVHNYNNYDWWVDDVKVQVFDKVGGGDETVTSGNWNDGDFWGGNVPDSGDDVIINANVTIPEGVVAEANQIVINTDTIQTGNRAEKFGKLTIADGGQLVTRNEVEATVQKSITGYGRGGSNWYLIAPPVAETLKPTSDSVSGFLDGSYDLYSFDGSQQTEEWRNYKQHEETFRFQNGTGYLVANSTNKTYSLTGTVLPSNQAKEVGLAFAETTFGAWNLVGNPYTCEAYLSDNRPFYRLEETTEGSKIVLAESNVIAPMEGVFVQAANGDDAVTFTTTEPTANANALNFSLRKVEQARGGNSPTGSATLDRARISFGEGPSLGHLDLMADANRLYIPLKGKEMAVVSAQPVGELPLNFEAAENGTFTLSFENAAEDLMYCHLIDNLTGIDIDLLTPVGRPPFKGGRGDSNEPRQAEYTFNAKTRDYASRFRVVFASVGVDANGDSETFAFENNGNWIIANEGRATLQVIDLNGRILSSEQIEGSVQTHIHQPAGLYLIRLVNGDNVKVQKVVVR